MQQWRQFLKPAKNIKIPEENAIPGRFMDQLPDMAKLLRPDLFLEGKMREK